MKNKKVWKPQHPEQSQMGHFIRYVDHKYSVILPDYKALHDWSIREPACFWQSVCDYFKLTFTTPAKVILNAYKHPLDAHWFEGATFNFAEKLLQRRDAHPALICVNEKGLRQVINYQQLYDLVSQCAAGLSAAGVTVGDRVVAVLPNSHFSIIGMLAAASMGAIWSSCSPDFGLDAIVDRFGQLEPTVLFIGDGHLFRGKAHDASEKIQALVHALPSLQQVIVCPVIESGHVFLDKPCQKWHDFLKSASTLTFAQLPFAHPLYILFSSGTTGVPKCIVHGAGGTLLQHLKELRLHCDISEKDTLLFYTTCGWMMWNWMASTLVTGATLTLYDGAPFYPEPDRLFKIIAQEKVTVFGCGAKIFSALEKAGVRPNQKFSLKGLRLILSTASPLLPKNYDFIYQQVNEAVQLSSISGGTDIISCFALGNPLLPVYRGELQCLGLGMAVAIYDESGESVTGVAGELVCTQAHPAMPIGFWNDANKKRYHEAYFTRFPGVWAQGDRAEITTRGGLIIYGRSDAVLNSGGVRIGTAEIYRQVEKISDVVDSVVIGQSWEGDVRMVLFVQLQQGLILNEALQQDIKKTIRANASPRHVPALIIQVPDIPRTISGKIVELAVRDVVHGRAVENVGALANPEALAYFRNRAEYQK